MNITQDKHFNFKTKNLYLGSCLEKGLPVDLYFNKAKNYYIGRYGEEEENYTSMSKELASSFTMVTHVLRQAYLEHEKLLQGVN